MSFFNALTQHFRKGSAKNFFSPREQKVITDAIAQAELKTSGEIRLHLEDHCEGNELRRAAEVFEKLGMHKTAERNGVLIYIATLSRKVAVIGDEGIHQKLGKAFWDRVVADLIQKFKADQKAEGLAACILECGAQLGNYFPRRSDDKDELSNDISF